MRSPRRTLFAALALSLALGVMACGGDSGAARSPVPDPSGPPEKTELKVATLPIIDNAALYVALKNGLFEKEGIKVTPVPIQAGPQGVPMLLNGEADVIFANYVSMFQANDTGVLQVKILAEGSRAAPQSLSIMALPGSPIKTPKDLEGKTINVQVLKNFQELALTQVLKRHGVDPTKITYVPVTFQDLVPAWQKGQIDAAYVGEPMVTSLTTKLGARKILDPASGPAAEFPISGYVTTRDWSARNPAASAAFRRAIHAAGKLTADRTSVTSVLPEFTQVDRATAERVTLPFFPDEDEPVRLQRVADWMSQAGWLSKPLDVTSLMR
ncbi:ABC transporter substrate-binding protein [Nonomuraea sp. NPDC050394]|uniref:ABC transporter substrate-binding protein n=1 Tax=Nonomuraea sp. NPDC050394 TaxID=3364363 RepID=UPI0037BBBAC8